MENVLELEPNKFSIRSKVGNIGDGCENLYFETSTSTKKKKKKNCNQTNLYFEAGTLILGRVKLCKKVVN